jgi:hypothetical protein
VLKPGIRIGGEIRVFCEDVFPADEFFQLDEVTFVTDVHMQRVERLHLVNLIRAEITLT